MTVLVTAGSKHGGTREIAEEIARVLDEHGVTTGLLDIDDVTDLSGYEAYVVGSGIYLGNWLKNARRFLDTHAAELAQRPTWLFASGSIVGEHPSLTTRMPFDPVASRGWSRRRKRVSTSSSPASWTRASSARSRELPCAARTRARATTATGTTSIAGPRRSRDR
jgi:Flavodoxin domain